MKVPGITCTSCRCRTSTQPAHRAARSTSHAGRATTVPFEHLDPALTEKLRAYPVFARFPTTRNGRQLTLSPSTAGGGTLGLTASDRWTKRSTTPSASARSRPSRRRPTSTTCAGGHPATGATPRASTTSTCARPWRRQVPLSALAKSSANGGPAAINHQASVPLGHPRFNLAPGASLSDAVHHAPPGQRRHRHADAVSGSSPGRRPTRYQSRCQPAMADSGGAGDGLHRSRRALRELRAPTHHHLDAALGRLGALLTLCGLRPGLFDHGADRASSC